MEVVELLKELIKRQSVTPNECGIYDIIKAELADFEAIEVEKNGVKNLFLYKDFSNINSSLGAPFALGENFGEQQTTSLVLSPKFSPNTKLPPQILELDSSKNDSSESNQNNSIANVNSSIFDEKLGLRSCERGNRTNGSLTKRTTSLPDLSQKDAEFATHLCFAGHIDIVPAGLGWSVPPFDALIQNGVLYGRGAQDMKGGIAAFVSALQKVKNFNGTLSVLLTSDEEGDGVFGTKIMLERLKERGLLPHFAIVAEPTCEKKLGDSIKIGRRGSINGVLTIYGVQGHAAYPHKCVNPLDLIAPILAQISSKDLDSGSEYFAPSKIVITDIRGGIETTNVTPAELQLMFNVRNNPLTDKNAIQNYVESLLKSAGIKKYDLSFSQSAFPFLGAESSIDSAISQNIGENNSVRSTQTRPLRGAKNREQGRSSASADFLLEADKRGSPPKSEKRQLLARRGSGAGGAALLRKESSEIDKNGGKGAESRLDSAILFNTLCNAIYKKTHIMPRPNTEGGTSDARYFSAFGVEVVEFGLVNDRIHAVDECVNLRDLEALRDIFVDFIVDFDSAIRVRKHPKKSPQDEF